MLSGHVHGYERFRERGRTFIVTGGGGGPRVEYQTGSEAPYLPAYVPDRDDGKRRAFNYVVLEDGGQRLLGTVKCLETGDFCPDGILERFTIALPGGATDPMCSSQSPR